MQDAGSEIRAAGDRAQATKGTWGENANGTRCERNEGERDEVEAQANGNEETGGGRDTEGGREECKKRETTYPRIHTYDDDDANINASKRRTAPSATNANTTVSEPHALGEDGAAYWARTRRLRTHARTPGAGCGAWGGGEGCSSGKESADERRAERMGRGDEWDGHDEENIQENEPAAQSGAERGTVPSSIASTLRRRQDAWRWCRVERSRLQPAVWRATARHPLTLVACGGRQSISLDWIGMWVSVRTDERGRRERKWGDVREELTAWAWRGLWGSETGEYAIGSARKTTTTPLRVGGASCRIGQR